jgi:hypothetical protein
MELKIDKRRDERAEISCTYEGAFIDNETSREFAMTIYPNIASEVIKAFIHSVANGDVKIVGISDDGDVKIGGCE